MKNTATEARLQLVERIRNGIGGALAGYHLREELKGCHWRTGERSRCTWQVWGLPASRVIDRRTLAEIGASASQVRTQLVRLEQEGVVENCAFAKHDWGRWRRVNAGASRAENGPLQRSTKGD